MPGCASRFGARVLFLAASLSLLAGCGDNGAAPSDDPTWGAPVWTLSRAPGTEQDPVDALWGPSEDDLFAIVSDEVLRFDGADWRSTRPADELRLGVLWGTSDQDVFVSGHPLGGGGGDRILHFDGASWTEQPTPRRFYLEDFWGSSPSDVYAVGAGDLDSLFGATKSERDARMRHAYGGVVLHYDGESWEAALGIEDTTFMSVCGTTRDDVYAASQEGVIYRFDGSVWARQETGRGWGYLRVGAGNDGVVFAVGGDGAVLVAGPAGWTLRSPPDEEFFLQYGRPSVWGSSVTDIWAATRDGWILRYDGAAWSRVETGCGVSFGGVWGRVPGEPYLQCETGAILHLDSGEWDFLREGSPATLLSVSGSPGNGVLAAGWMGHGALVRFEQGEWRVLRDSFSSYLTMRLWCWPDRSALLAGGWQPLHGISDRVYLARLAGEEFDTLTVDLPGRLLDAWGPSPDDFIAVGYDVGPSGLIYRWDGTHLVEEANGRFDRLVAVWGASSDDVFAVSGDGMIIHWDGTEWSVSLEDAGAYLADIWGLSGADVYAVGSGGTIVHFDGSTWSPQESDTWHDLYGVWGSAAAGVTAVGDKGTVVHYDGSRWAMCPRYSWDDLYAVWGSDVDGIYAVGENGIVLWSPPPLSGHASAAR